MPKDALTLSDVREEAWGRQADWTAAYARQLPRTPDVIEMLKAMRRPWQSYSDVILRLPGEPT